MGEPLAALDLGLLAQFGLCEGRKGRGLGKARQLPVDTEINT